MHFCEVENDFCRHSSSFLEDEALDEEWKWNAIQDRFQKGIGDAMYCETNYNYNQLPFHSGLQQETNL